MGPVLSFKLVFDRETGKPKGYGFCEYKDQETALSAMRNLNGYEIGGRSLRVDNACTEKSRMEMQALMQGPQVNIFCKILFYFIFPLILEKLKTKRNKRLLK